MAYGRSGVAFYVNRIMLQRCTFLLVKETRVRFLACTNRAGMRTFSLTFPATLQETMAFVLLVDPIQTILSRRSISLNLSTVAFRGSYRFVRVTRLWLVYENCTSQCGSPVGQEGVIRRLTCTNAACTDTMEPNLPNDCYVCNRTCINSEAAAFQARPRRYFQHLYRPSVLSRVLLFTTPITPRRIHRFLFRRIIPPLSSYKQSMYHSSMANYETRADARCVLRTYNWMTLLHSRCNSYEFLRTSPFGFI